MHTVPAIGRYVQVTSSARVDAIGKVVGHQDGFVPRVVVEIPNWTADGMPVRWSVALSEIERSTAAEARKAARLR